MNISVWYSLILAMIASFCERESLFVYVTNDGHEPLRSAEVHVTGSSYSLGDLAPHGKARVKVEPRSESRITISFLDSQGQRRQIDAGGYIEPGTSGRISIVLDSSRVFEFKNRTL